MAAKFHKSHKKIRKAFLRGERFREKGRIRIRLDKLRLEKIIWREAMRRKNFKKKHGVTKYFISLAIVGFVEIVRSLRKLPKTRKNRILRLETEQLKITEYLKELNQRGLKILSAEEHNKLIELYCDLLKRKIDRMRRSDKVKRRQLINELQEYEQYLENTLGKNYVLGDADRHFLTDLIRLINEEINYLLEHEQKYYAEARKKLSKILEDVYRQSQY